MNDTIWFRMQCRLARIFGKKINDDWYEWRGALYPAKPK